MDRVFNYETFVKAGRERSEKERKRDLDGKRRIYLKKVWRTFYSRRLSDLGLR